MKIIEKQKIAKNKTIKFLADNNISFEAKEGEVVGILGPNGAGKTTLLRMIAGIMSPTSGEVIIDGKKIKCNNVEINLVTKIEGQPLGLKVRVDNNKINVDDGDMDTEITYESLYI